VLPLGQVAVHLSVINLARIRCDQRGRLSTARPVAEHGASMRVLLRTIAANCPGVRAVQVHDACAVHLPQL
jgi:hypothetical protein